MSESTDTAGDHAEASMAEWDHDASHSSDTSQPDRGQGAHLVLCSILQMPIWSFAMTYGILQDYFSQHLVFEGNSSSTGVVGTTMNSVIYLSMPILAALFSDRLIHWRRTSAICGLLLSSGGLFASSFSTSIWHLVVTQGVLSAFGNSLLYSALTLCLDERFLRRKGFAYGTILSSKNVVGTGGPFVVSAMLAKLGFRTTLQIWAGINLVVGLPGACMMHPRRRPAAASSRHGRRIPWTFLKHPTFWIYQTASMVFSSGYGLPQTYLSMYASQVNHLPTSTSSLMLALFNGPGILASVSFGMLCDGLSIGGKFSMSVASVTCMSGLGSALAAFLFWGLSTGDGVAMLVLFACLYGFFASGYSATWGGVMKEMEREASEHEESIDTGVIYGLLNGGRGVGYLAGGFAGVELLKAGAIEQSKWGYGSQYGSLILFTGLSAACGGWARLWRGRGLFSR